VRGRGSIHSPKGSERVRRERTRLLKDLGLDTHLLRERLAALKALHEPAADIVLAVPLDLLARLTVEDEPDRELAVLVHLARNIVAPAELVAESEARVVEQEAADAPERFGRKELDLGVRVARVDEAGRVD